MTRILAIISIIFITGCSSKDYFINSEYAGNKNSDVTMLITKIDNVGFSQEMTGFNFDEIDSIKIMYSGLFNKDFNKHIKTESKLENVGYLEYKKTPQLENQTFNLGEDKITVAVPKSKVDLGPLKNIYILFIQDVSLRFVKKEKDTSDPAKHYTAEPTPGNDVEVREQKFFDNVIYFNANYFIYDNDSEKIVCYGKANIKDKLAPRQKLVNLMKDVIEKQADKIISGSPFKD